MKRHVFPILSSIALSFSFVVAHAPTTRAQEKDQTAGNRSTQRRSPEEASAELARRKIKPPRNSSLAPAELRNAALEGNLELVTLFLDAGIDPNAKNQNGFPLLHTAACNDRIEVMDELLERGADIEARDSEGDAALVMAVNCQRLASVEYLLNKGANINSQRQGGATTALSLAVELLTKENDEIRKKIVLTLLERGANPNLSFATGYTILMEAACGGDPDVVRALLARGADVNAVDRDGDTALLLALRCEHDSQPQIKAGILDVVKVLLAHGANPDATANDGKTALKLAKDRRESEVVFLLLEPQLQSSLWTRIKYYCYWFNKAQGWGGPVIYLLAVIISGIALKRQKPLKREKVEEGDGLPRLAPLKCDRCAAPVPISLTKSECPSCGAEAKIPEDYTETLRLRANAAAVLHKAERIWKRASFYTQDRVFFLLFAIGVAWLAGSIIGFFSEYSTVRPITIFVSTILGTITFPGALYATSDYLAREKSLFPKLPEIGKELARAEDASCKTCGAPARFEVNDLVASCSYCGSDLYRAALARKARKVAGEEEEGATFSLYDAIAALEDRRRSLFKSIEAIGSFLLLVIAVTAVSLIIIAVLVAVLALYLYLTFS